jgi:hypothetical protein
MAGSSIEAPIAQAIQQQHDIIFDAAASPAGAPAYFLPNC